MTKLFLGLTLVLAACGTPEPVVSEQAPLQKSAAAVTSATDATTTTHVNDPAAPFDGDWSGKIEQVFTPSTSVDRGVSGPIDDACNVAGTPNTWTETAVGTLTISKNTGVFKGILTDNGDRLIYDSFHGQYYCVAHNVTTAVEQTVNLSINTNSIDITCDPASCGTGLGDWRIGAAGTELAIVARITDNQTHLIDDTNQIFSTFEFWKK